MLSKRKGLAIPAAHTSHQTTLDSDDGTLVRHPDDIAQGGRCANRIDTSFEPELLESFGSATMSSKMRTSPSRV
jgi:hypothetical protein